MVTRQSGRGQPHSKTLARLSRADRNTEGLGVRLPSAALIAGPACPTFFIAPLTCCAVDLRASADCKSAIQQIANLRCLYCEDQTVAHHRYRQLSVPGLARVRLSSECGRGTRQPNFRG